jgi:hypothetical protein
MGKLLNISLLTFALFLQGCVVSDPVYDNFAKCVTGKNVKMYGTYWCHNCTKQKELFAEAFQYIDYIECDARGEKPQPEFCLKKGIQAYPTWEFSDGSRVEGTMPLEKIAEKTNCKLENEQVVISK